MNRLSILRVLGCAWAVVLSAVGFAWAETATPSQGARIALVVGNSNYGGDLGLLANPVNDSRLVAGALKRIGFDVIEVEDADQNALKRAIAEFGDRMAEAGGDATSLFFYAGHGLQVGGQNYLIPIHAEIGRERDVDIEAISLETVLKQMAWADSKVNIVILDACRNNPLSRGFRSTTQGLAEITVKPQGSFISYSTAPGDVAVDGNGTNSPFSAALAEAIEKPGLDINDVFREVRADVMSATKGKQVPWDSSSLTAPYYFVPAAAEKVLPQTMPFVTAGVDPKTIELTFWEAIKDSKSPDDFEAYLEKYPEGEFAGLARIRVKQLGAVPAAPVAQAATIEAQPGKRSPDLSADIELTYWNSVKDAAEKEGFVAYLKKYPDGHFAELAKARLAELDAEAKKTEVAALTPAPTPTPPTPPKIAEMDATFVARQSANVRAEPGTDAKIIARLKEDDAVAVTGKVEGKDWYRAKTDAGVGYISAGLLQQADADAIAAWQAAKKAGTIQSVEAFQKQHPGSVFDAKAKKLLASLQPPPAPVAAAQPAPAPVKPATVAAQAPAVFTTASAKPPEKAAVAPAQVEQAAALPAPAPADSGELRVGDTFEVQARGTTGITGGWWGATQVTLVIEGKTGENEFEGKLTGSGQLNFFEECDIEVDGDKIVVRGTTSSVDNKPDVLRFTRTAPDRYEGRVQSGSFMGTGSMTRKSRGAA